MSFRLIGGLVGSFLAICLLIFLITCCKRRCCNKTKKKQFYYNNHYLQNEQLRNYDPYYLAPTSYPLTNVRLQPLAIAPKQNGLNQHVQPFQQTQQTKCSICTQAKTVIILKPCGHKFHINCFVKWRQNNYSCPNCCIFNYKAYMKCFICNFIGKQLTFCPIGCQKPNHLNCFSQRNHNKNICTECIMNKMNSYPQNQIVVY